jgi:hypothetical protein
MCDIFFLELKDSEKKEFTGMGENIETMCEICVLEIKYFEKKDILERPLSLSL